MKTKNTNLESEIESTEPMEKPEKHFNVYLAIGKFLLGGLAVISILFTAKAAFTDTVLENLEANYASTIYAYGHAKVIAIESNQHEREMADAACDAFRALKSYKESKKLTLKNDSNPCVELAAPQETGSQNLQ